ncbi:hypothetical protein QO004_003746 [Rhizobium mesoamericanum]|uniref:hypothetical protein n=1 Tax=Rhizobium mesoamericanum TaxID=1079800 RepID=UPI0027875656|nr:hypothetical protein [Rhizobium mesoamericanum]MDQ0561945.1 hypothetical protein [Rhizobium mesoamericanum]
MKFCSPSILQWCLLGFFLVVLPFVLGCYITGFYKWDLTIPAVYGNSDDIWQLVLTKMVRDTGWVLTNPFLGAPDVAHWHSNSAAQTSALHSVLMLGLSFVINDAVKIQQIYYLINFPLIALSSYHACRLVTVSRLPAICVGLLFAFTTFRINWGIYAFLANYFAIPLGVVPVIWIAAGVFRNKLDLAGARAPFFQSVRKILLTRQFGLSLLFVAIVAVSDGYYAFFTLMLLGFAACLRALSGDWRLPASLTPALLLMAALVGISLLLNQPLSIYKASHPQEFYPGGTMDLSLIKHPFEAEVYSSSLKLLIAPISNHRIPFLAEIGRWIVSTSDQAAKFPQTRAFISLGTLGTILLVGGFIYFIAPALRASMAERYRSSQWTNFEASISLVLFSTLCAIPGGIGTLVALVFPTIRAYNRFPLFLIFFLYLAAALLLTIWLQRAQSRGKGLAVSIALILATVLALVDQIPADAVKGREESKSTFLAERAFVAKIESELPPSAMVYQYPYADYLLQSKYYGWGSFAPVRLYLHSKALRWSNGAAKNSYVEGWQLWLARLPVDDMLNEIVAAGFAGMVIDRTVVKGPEYRRLVESLSRRGVQLVDDSESQLAFARLNDSGVRLQYDEKYTEPTSLSVIDRARLKLGALPPLIDREAFAAYVERQPMDENTFVVTRIEHPELFLGGAEQRMGLGDSPIKDPTALRGTLSCAEDSTLPGNVALALHNNSSFDWWLGTGSYPISIGWHVSDDAGKQLLWDDGGRAPRVSVSADQDGSSLFVGRGKTIALSLPLSGLALDKYGTGKSPLKLEFQVVQDGNVWFADLTCTMPVVR